MSRLGETLAFAATTPALASRLRSRRHRGPGLRFGSSGDISFYEDTNHQNRYGIRSFFDWLRKKERLIHHFAITGEGSDERSISGITGDTDSHVGLVAGRHADANGCISSALGDGR